MGQVTGEHDSGPQADCTRPWQDTRAPWAAGEPLSSSQAAAQPLQAAAAAVGGATTIGQAAQLPHTISAAGRAAPTEPGAATPQPLAGTASTEAMPAAPSRGITAQPGAVDVSQADTGAPWAASLAFRQPRPGPDAAGVAQAGEAAPQSGPADGGEPSCAAALPTTSAAALRNSHRIAEPPAGQHNRPLEEAQPNGAGPAPAPVAGTAAPWARPAGAHALVGQPVEPVVVAEPRMPAAARPLPPPRASPQCITDAQTLQRFLTSQAARDFVGFLLALNDAVRGKALSDPCPASPAVDALLEVLATLSRWVDEVPPSTQSLRYGNPAYRVWAARAAAAAEGFMERVLGPGLAPLAPELAPYLPGALGNAQRIDYGTGHETAFAALLFCLARAGAVGEADRQALVTRVFAAYLALMRKVQTTYWLEPAGSHGVWGLDDYQFLPFVWGAAQLVGHPHIRPRSIHSHEVLAACSADFLYLAAVRFVRQVKKGPLAETSPMLNDISGVPSWEKVNKGMIKMYQVEVLSKFPIMQHFIFCRLFGHF